MGTTAFVTKNVLQKGFLLNYYVDYDFYKTCVLKVVKSKKENETLPFPKCDPGYAPKYTRSINNTNCCKFFSKN